MLHLTFPVESAPHPDGIFCCFTLESSICNRKKHTDRFTVNKHKTPKSTSALSFRWLRISTVLLCLVKMHTAQVWNKWRMTVKGNIQTSNTAITVIAAMWMWIHLHNTCIMAVACYPSMAVQTVWDISQDRQLNLSRCLSWFTKRLPGCNSLTYIERRNKLNLTTLELRRLYYDHVMCYKIVFNIVALNSVNSLLEAHICLLVATW